MRRPRQSALCAVVVIAMLLTGGAVEASATSNASKANSKSVQMVAAAPSKPGAVVSVRAARIADSRSQQQITGPIPALGTAAVKVTGWGGVPTAGVATVVLTVTIASPRSSGYITAWPGGRPKPDTSNLNFTAGRTIATNTIVPVGADGGIQLFNGSSAGTDVIVDVTGYTTAGAANAPGALVPVDPSRIADSRTGLQIARTVPGSATVPIKVAGRGGVPTTGVSAAVLTLTVAQPQAAGYISAWPGGVARTNTSPLNFTAGSNIATTTLVPVGSDGTVQLFNGASGGTELIVDVVGYIVSGTLASSGAVSAVTPSRIADSRRNQQISGPVGDSATVTVTVGGLGPVPSRDVAAVFLTVTVVPRGTGYLSIWMNGAAQPATSAMNFSAGIMSSTTTLVPVDTGRINLANTSSDSVDLIIDVVGYTLAETAKSDAPTAVSGGTPRPDRDPSDPTFTIAVMPDTQQEVFAPDQRFKNRSDWLVAQSGPQSLDLRYVTHTGDVVNWNTPNHDQYAWASQALQPLTVARIPWSLSNGNHDNEATGPGGSARDPMNTITLLRDTTTWNSYFTADRYGAVNGAFESGKTDNIYSEFYAGGKRWMVLNLEMWPRVAVVNWAQGVVADHPHDNVVIATHSYLNSDGSIGQQAEYGATSPQYLYDNLISRYSNIKMVFSGHTGEAASRTDVGVNGNTVYSFVAAIHSNSTNPVRLVYIDTRAGTIQSRIVAPWNNAADWMPYNLDITGVDWVS